MNQEASMNRSHAAESSPFLSFKVSWVGYVALIWKSVLRVLLLGGLAALVNMVIQRSGGGGSPMLVWVGVAFALVWVVYDFFYLRTMTLYTDDSGVWLHSGIFPWQRGVAGVKWRDISEATFQMGFVSWMLRSYSVRVGNRFTQGAELFLPNIHRGNLAVEHINSIVVRVGGRA